ncbi:MAG: endonuclease/exonuclease/phosphatase family protein [Dysgonamonadaceae bacterium]|jgi:endonuclease/exonuclease/phosphatase family metal-dependent hydrolase|nr:endonuclease/exonuclease/phosphatase family protein [Dysgonamonadaceae bacterium]
MKKLFLFLLAVAGLTACQTATNKVQLKYNDNGTFKIAQFTDMHFIDGSPNSAKTEATIRYVLETEKPDVAILTGDQVIDKPSKDVWPKIARIFEEARTPFAVVFGNHDAETITRDSVFDILSRSPYFIGERGPEDIHGIGNYILEVRSRTSDKPAALLYCFDSNDYTRNDKLGHYDWIRYDQIAWYRQQSKRYTQANNNQPLPALAFFHIPLQEYANIAGKEATVGTQGEGIAYGKINSGMFASFVDMQDVMGVFVGHDHDNDYIGIAFDIALAFGRVTGADAYGKLERGARIIELYEDKPDVFTTWIRVPSGVEHKFYYPSRQPLPLHVMTFNIRYDNPVDGPDNWQYRKDVATEMIKEYDVDLLGTQEVLINQLHDLKERLPQYAATGVGRADGKEAGEYCAIFYKQDKFEAEKSGNFWLSETPEIAGSKGWDGACERIATWAILREKQSNKRLFFINTHLDHVGKIARREGVKLLLERAKAESNGLPVIITGDFNASLESEAIQQVLAGKKFFDTRLLAPSVPEISGTYHGFGKAPAEEREIIDYIFVTGGIAVNTYTIIPEKRNDIYLSDHNPVYVEIEIK